MRGPLDVRQRSRRLLATEEDSFEAGGDVDEVTVSLRVWSPELDPDAVTSELGVSPSFSARRGDRRASKTGEITQRTGIWILELAESTEWQLADGITTLLDQLPNDLRVWRNLTSKATVDLYCGLHLANWNRGVELPADVLGRLAERGIALHLDIYYDPPDSEADV